MPILDMGLRNDQLKASLAEASCGEKQEGGPGRAAFFLIVVPVLHPYERILRRVADRAGPVIGQVFELLSFFRFIVDIAAYSASPHDSLLG